MIPLIREDATNGQIPDASWPGVILAGLSLVVMPALGFAKLRLAGQLQSPALHADAMETLVCAYLSLALLLGLVLNAAFGWWWADPAAALCMVPLMLKEGWEGIRGEAYAHEAPSSPRDSPENAG